jgi:hypothetical protein
MVFRVFKERAAAISARAYYSGVNTRTLRHAYYRKVGCPNLEENLAGEEISHRGHREHGGGEICVSRDVSGHRAQHGRRQRSGILNLRRTGCISFAIHLDSFDGALHVRQCGEPTANRDIVASQAKGLLRPSPQENIVRLFRLHPLQMR